MMIGELREPEIAYGKKQLSLDEYLQWEQETGMKYEYFKGEIFEGTKLR